MTQAFKNKALMPLRIFTGWATYDGLLTISLNFRTQDELNLEARRFLTLSSPTVFAGRWPLEAGPFAINKSAILFVLELPDLGATLGMESVEPDLGRYPHAMIRLRVGEFRIQGYVHTIQIGEPLSLLQQTGHSFFAITAATINGPGTDCASPFVAVNRSHIDVVQEILSIEATAEDLVAGETGT